jgi:hypothetical protein
MALIQQKFSMSFSTTLFQGTIGARYIIIYRKPNNVLTLRVANVGNAHKTTNLSFFPTVHRKWLLVMSILTQVEAEIIIPYILSCGQLR